MENKKDLEECRLEINRIDEQIAGLFEQRMDVARDIAEYKKEYGLQIFDAAREQEVCDREVNFIHNPDYRPYYLEFLKAMMSTGKRFQSQVIKGSKIAYCGIEGAWANIAARRIFPDGNLVSFPSFDKAYESVVKGHCDFAVLPVENSYAGNVNQVFDLMHQGSLFINGMYNLKIAQALLGIKGATIYDSMGAVQYVGHDMIEPPPMFGSLRQYIHPDNGNNKTILILLEDAQLAGVKKIVNDVTGGLSKPDVGVSFTLPVA